MEKQIDLRGRKKSHRKCEEG